jgi:hypothetical protein
MMDILVRNLNKDTSTFHYLNPKVFTLGQIVQSTIVFQPTESTIKVTFYSLRGGNAMIARLTRLQAKIDELDEVTYYFDMSVLPALKMQTGFRSSYLLVDRETGNCISIVLWDTERNALADETSGSYQERLNLVKDLVVSPTVREVYEVASRYPMFKQLDS